MTLKELKELYPPKEDDETAVADLPEAIHSLVDNECAIMALGAMIWYLRQLNIDKALLSARNFNIYDPLRKGQALLLDGQTLAHIEVGSLFGSETSGTTESWFQVLLNSDGTEEGTLHHLLGRCITPYGEHDDSHIRRHSDSWGTQESGCSVYGFAILCAISGLSMIGKSSRGI